jgi:hypothetical protein
MAIGGALVILGCCALAFACLLAWVEWGRTSGGWFSNVDFSVIAREVGIAMAIFAVIGLTGIAFGWRLRRMKRGVNDGRRQKVVWNVK